MGRILGRRRRSEGFFRFSRLCWDRLGLTKFCCIGVIKPGIDGDDLNACELLKTMRGVLSGWLLVTMVWLCGWCIPCFVGVVRLLDELGCACAVNSGWVIVKRDRRSGDGWRPYIRR